LLLLVVPQAIPIFIKSLAFCYILIDLMAVVIPDDRSSLLSWGALSGALARSQHLEEAEMARLTKRQIDVAIAGAATCRPLPDARGVPDALVLHSRD